MSTDIQMIRSKQGRELSLVKSVVDAERDKVTEIELERDSLKHEFEKEKEISKKQAIQLEQINAELKVKSQTIAELEGKLSTLSSSSSLQLLQGNDLFALGAAELLRQEKRVEEYLNRIKQVRQDVLTNELAAIKKDRCAVCNSAPRQLVLLPCRHFNLCISCGEKVTICPTCGKPIQSKMNINDDN